MLKMENIHEKSTKNLKWLVFFSFGVEWIIFIEVASILNGARYVWHIVWFVKCCKNDGIHAQSHYFLSRVVVFRVFVVAYLENRL